MHVNMKFGLAENRQQTIEEFELSEYEAWEKEGKFFLGFDFPADDFSTIALWSKISKETCFVEGVYPSSHAGENKDMFFVDLRYSDEQLREMFLRFFPKTKRG